MRVAVSMVTVGEKITQEGLRSIANFTPKPYDLTIWYDACGRGVDLDFLAMLRSYTKDVIISEQQKPVSACWGFLSLYQPFDFFVGTCPDFIVAPDYFARMMQPFKDVPRCGVSGEAFRRMREGERWAVSDPDRGIDGIVALKREALDDVGGFSPSFNGRGPFHQELYRRIARNGWEMVAVDGLCVHGGGQHEGRDKDPNWVKDLHQDNLLWLRLTAKDYRGYKWWSKSLSDVAQEQPVAA